MYKMQNQNKILSFFLKILNIPIFYSIVMKVLGSDLVISEIFPRYIRPNAGDSVLDLGCGPAHLFPYFPDNVH